MSAVSFKFILLQIFIIIPFVCGSWLRGHLLNPDIWNKRLIRFTLISLEPLFAIWVVWGLELNRNHILLPPAGFVLVLLGLLGGFLILKLLPTESGPDGYSVNESNEPKSDSIASEKNHRLTFYISSSLSNHGFTLGGFLCFLLLGEEGLALSYIMLVYFYPYVFLVVFPLARLSGQQPESDLIAADLTPEETRLRRRRKIREAFLSWNHLPLYGALLALALRAMGFERPQYDRQMEERVLESMLFVAVVLYYFSLGLAFSAGAFWRYRGDLLRLCLVKFLFVPIVVWLVLFGIDAIWSVSASVANVILIEAVTPAAIYSVIAAVLYGLKRELAASLFVGSTVIFLILIVPFLYVLRSLYLWGM
ncbi:MAG: hypothetical protein KDK30_04185 [Leptospiraceae bacterium]|nr:hypothetical protein [Leptospiraceae bacterium]